jgi:hypothetical protein
MKLTFALVLGAVTALAACGGGMQEGLVKYTGLVPNTVRQIPGDSRKMESFCPGCRAPIEFGLARHLVKQQNMQCDTKLLWKKDYPCGSCDATGICRACLNMEQTEGKCYNCKGAGYLIYQGKTPECSNCTGKGGERGKCPVCKGTRKCDYCAGEGKLPDSVVKEKIAKARPAEESEEKKPEAPKVEEKKPEAPAAPEEKKPEEKKP